MTRVNENYQILIILFHYDYSWNNWPSN